MTDGERYSCCLTLSRGPQFLLFFTFFFVTLVTIFLALSFHLIFMCFFSLFIFQTRYLILVPTSRLPITQSVLPTIPPPSSRRCFAFVPCWLLKYNFAYSLTAVTLGEGQGLTTSRIPFLSSNTTYRSNQLRFWRPLPPANSLKPKQLTPRKVVIKTAKFRMRTVLLMNPGLLRNVDIPNQRLRQSARTYSASRKVPASSHFNLAWR